jgi:hypothetical protein
MTSRNGLLSRMLFLSSAFAASAVVALTSGCASGGFKLTRMYAQFVNSQNIIIRIILYILTGVVFAVTMLVDLVVNNTIDFWNGTVAAGSYNFKDGGKTFVAHHEIMPGTNLKRSTIDVSDATGKHLQTVVLQQTPKNEIELYVDGTLRTRVNHINELPVASIYDAKGTLIQDGVVVAAPAFAIAAH